MQAFASNILFEEVTQKQKLLKEVIETTKEKLDALKSAQEQAKTAFSALECAEALNYLALAGYNTQQMCDTPPTVLNLAAAGDIDLASASDMVTDAMSALGMGTDEATTMVDQMSKTTSTTNTSVEMFENIAYIMTKHADPSIPDSPEEWLDEFSTFSIYQVLPKIIELCGLNVQSEV